MGLFTINIQAKVNQPPSAIGDNTIIVQHDSTYTFTVANFTSETVPAYLDPDGDDIKEITILSLLSPGNGILEYNSVPVTLNQVVSASGINSGLLKYISDSGTLTVYSDVFTFDAADLGSSSYSGLVGTITLNVGGYINQPPTTGDNSVSINHSESKVFTAADFTTATTPAYNDPEGDAPLNLRVNTLPVNGTLKLSGTPVIVNQVIPFTNITAGSLIYTASIDITTLRTVEFDFDIEDAGSGQFG